MTLILSAPVLWIFASVFDVSGLDLLFVTIGLVLFSGLHLTAWMRAGW